jgi:hypothetical protein
MKICQSLALTSACARLKKLQSIQPLQDLSTPEAKKNQRICKEAFEKFKNIHQNIQTNNWISPKRKLAASKLFVTESYRLGKLYGGIDRLALPDQEALEFLMKEALEYKKNPKKAPIRFDDEKDYLTDEQVAQLEELAHYPDYVSSCKKNRVLLEESFNWSLLNRLSVRVLVEFPPIVARIDKSLLKGRIESDPDLLKFHDSNGIKDVTLAFEGKDVSLRSEKKEITFSNGLIHTVETIFKIFQMKNRKEGHLTFVPGLGVINYDSMEYGPLNPNTKKVDSIDFNRPDWHRQLHMKAHLTQDQATEKFGFPCDGTNWVMTVVAARQNKRFDIYSGHSFLRLAIPREDGTYDYTYGFGKFTKKYPQNALHAAGYLFAPKPAAVQYPDNNEFYTHRQLKEFHFSLTAEKGADCLDSWKNDILQSKKNNRAFQYLAKNCTDWTVEKIQQFVGEKESRMFDLKPYLKLEPSGFLGGLLKILRNVTDWFRRLVLNCLACLFCGWKRIKITHEDGRKEVVSVFKTSPWDLNRPFHHPGVPFRSESHPS